MGNAAKSAFRGAALAISLPLLYEFATGSPAGGTVNSRQAKETGKERQADRLGDGGRGASSYKGLAGLAGDEEVVVAGLAGEEEVVEQGPAEEHVGAEEVVEQGLAQVAVLEVVVEVEEGQVGWEEDRQWRRWIETTEVADLTVHASHNWEIIGEAVFGQVEVMLLAQK